MTAILIILFLTLTIVSVSIKPLRLLSGMLLFGLGAIICLTGVLLALGVPMIVLGIIFLLMGKHAAVRKPKPLPH